MTRPVSAGAQAIRAERRSIVEIPMVWITGKNRETLEPESIGLWKGPDDEEISVIDLYTGVQQTRLFYGRGELLDVSGVEYEVGLNYRMIQISLSGLGPAAEQAVRGYDARGGRCQVWNRCYDPRTMVPVDAERVFKGTIQNAPIVRGTPGGEASITLDVTSPAIMLTIASNLKKSHEALKARSAADTFRAYKATIATATVPWGTDDERIT